MSIKPMEGIWEVLLTETAEQDYIDIIRWTVQNFGEHQAKTYSLTLNLALATLEKSPNIIGAKQREELGARIYTLHVVRNGKKGRHIIVFCASEGNTIEVLRLLHDSMDFESHL